MSSDESKIVAELRADHEAEILRIHADKVAHWRARIDADAKAERLAEALRELLGQFDQAHSALGVDRSPSAQEAIANARTALTTTAQPGETM
jgi:hypothetical protein